MGPSSLGIIGFGNIARLLVQMLGKQLPAHFACCHVLVMPGKACGYEAPIERACASISKRCQVHASIETFEAATPALVIECAGHAVVSEHVAGLLSAGCETIISSVGALGDDTLCERLQQAAKQGGTRLVIPSGAIGALDIVAGLKHAGIHSVHYRSRKPPGAWQGTRADQLLDLDSLTEAAVFYDGSARAAVSDYPKNANVAAALSLAGVGFDKTVVQLIADPGVTANIHEFDVKCAAGWVAIRIEGKSSADNPKTSLPTVFSLVREVMNRIEPLAI